MDRNEFAKRLTSIMVSEGVEPEVLYRSILPISEALVQMMPQSLFRYRPFDINDKEIFERQIDAFKNDKVIAVTADKFNDPYDTLVRYDINAIKEFINASVSLNSLLQIKSYLEQGNDFPDSTKQMYPKGFIDDLRVQILSHDIESMRDDIERYKSQLLLNIDFWYPLIAIVSKRFVTIACFCETVQSIPMWSHYASSHQGFTLEYDFRPTLSKGIENCVIYPVIYDDERIDASMYMACSFLKSNGIRINNPDALSHIKCSLYKAKLWEYEKEWRLINYTHRDATKSGSSVIQYKPSAIYYGAQMQSTIKKQLHEIAKDKGIKEYEMYIDDSSPKYEMLYKPYIL
ncbi:MAG: DUF2971 domain-containing protein [Bacteroidales bacterium]|nr:DUF2971 domain-containing protein [Bacteroidales bacterium]